MSNINEFNVGGSHEQNPIGGIPVGVNEETGQPQLVEEGETMYSVKGIDFIFSNNYKLTTTDVKDNALPSNIAGKSMSDASKMIDKIFKDREDGISSNTKNQFLTRIANLQESKKQAEAQKMQAVLQQNADAGYVDDIPMEGMNPMQPDPMMDPANMAQPAQEQFAEGGVIDGTTGFGGGKGAAGIDYAGAAIGTIGLIDQASGNTSPNTLASAGSGALAGASVGTMIFPGIGTAIGAAVGGIAGTIGAGAAQKKAKNQATNIAKQYNNQFRDMETFAKGGVKNKRTALDSFSSSLTPVGTVPMGNTQVNPNGIPSQNTSNFQPSFRNRLDLALEPVKDNFDPSNALRMAPILSNFNQLRGMKQPQMNPALIDTTTATRRPIDEAALLNTINTSASTGLNAINQTGMGASARRNAILASNLSRNRAAGQAMMAGQQANIQMDERADMLDAQTRAGNIGRMDVARENFDRDLGAYNTSKSAMTNTLANSIGNVGLENRNRNVVGKLYGYDAEGRYLGGNSNPMSPTPSILDNTIQAQQQRNVFDASAAAKQQQEAIMRRQYLLDQDFTNNFVPETVAPKRKATTKTKK